MKLPANVLILVADGRKAIVLRNTGDEMFPNLKTEWSVTDQNPATASQGTDRPGRVHSNDRRSSVEQTDWHNQQEVSFAKRAAAAFEEFARDRRARQIVIVSPPRTLAVIRRALDDASIPKVIGELPHDLVNKPVADIEAFLGRATIAS